MRVAEALAAIAADLKGHIGRYGGEEFILVVPSGSEFNAQAFGDLICRSVFDASLEHSGRRDGVDVVTVSAGIATSQLMALAKMEQLVQQADLRSTEPRNMVATDPMFSRRGCAPL